MMNHANREQLRGRQRQPVPMIGRGHRLLRNGCAVALGLIALLAGCNQAMDDQPRYEALERSSFFKDEKVSRDFVPGTVARGQLRIDRHLYEGLESGGPATSLPAALTLTEDFLERGRERYEIFCAVCHDRAGTGAGIVVRRGYPQPPSLHITRLQEAPLGHFYDVITNGIRKMPAYASQIPVEDRWAIVAYIRVLQKSQYLELAEAPEDIQNAVTE